MLSESLSPEKIRKEFRQKTQNPAYHALLGATLNLFEVAERRGEILERPNSAEISKRLHQGNFGACGRTMPENPSVSVGRMANGREQVYIGGVADASSKHDWLLAPGVIGVRILYKEGAVNVERSPTVELELTDSQIIDEVTKELKDANARTYLHFSEARRR